jgi:dUTPase
MPSLTTEMPPLKVKRLSEDAQLPKRGSSKAAGYDLFRYLLICCPSNTQ